jgi:hypothetical protein
MKWMWAVALVGWIQDSPEAQRVERLDQSIRRFYDQVREATRSRDAEVRERAALILQETDRRPMLSIDDPHGVILDVAAQKQTLRKTLEYLSRQSRTDIVMTPAVRDAVGEAPVDLTEQHQVSLATVLAHVCRAFRVRWLVQNGAVVVDRVPSVPIGLDDTRKVDIRSLIQKYENTPPFQTSLTSMVPVIGGPGVSFTLEEPEQPIISSDDIVTLITEQVDPKVWEESDRWQINMTPNQELVISAPPETHDKIDAYLQSLHPLIHRQWEGMIWILAVTPARAASIEKDTASGSWADLLKDAARAKEIALLGQGRVLGYPCQQVFVSNRQTHRFIFEYDSDGVPNYQSFSEGAHFWVRGVPEDDSTIMLELTVAYTSLVGMEKLQTKKGEIQVPELAEAKIRTTQTIPEGTPTVLGRLPCFRGGPAGLTTVFFVGRFNRYVPK